MSLLVREPKFNLLRVPSYVVFQVKREEIKHLGIFVWRNLYENDFKTLV